MTQGGKRLVAGLGWGSFLPVLLIALLTLGWELLAWQNFGYPLLHRWLSIGVTIDEYGPKNPVRPGFQQTDLQERSRLFAGIVRAIHHQGEGLTGLVYRNPQGEALGKLLTPAEVLHLQDVARTVDLLRPAGWVACTLLLIGSLAICRWRLAPPWRVWLPSLAGLALLSAGLLWGVGAEPLFYQLHHWWFPAGHQWFFYYEESLMSMMMKAPDLFGAIAAIWLALAVTLLLLWQGLISACMRRPQP